MRSLERVDRSTEFLGSGDGAKVQVRRCLLRAVRQFMDGKTPVLADHSQIGYGRILPLARRIRDGEVWENLL
jgi:hypothetical protein